MRRTTVFITGELHRDSLRLDAGLVAPNTLSKLSLSLCPRLLIYGIYCSRVEIAIAVLDLICKEKEDVRLKLEVGRLSFSKRTNTCADTQHFHRTLMMIFCTASTVGWIVLMTK